MLRRKAYFWICKSSGWHKPLPHYRDRMFDIIILIANYAKYCSIFPEWLTTIMYIVDKLQCEKFLTHIFQSPSNWSIHTSSLQMSDLKTIFVAKKVRQTIKWNCDFGFPNMVVPSQRVIARSKTEPTRSWKYNYGYISLATDAFTLCGYVYQDFVKQRHKVKKTLFTDGF